MYMHVHVHVHVLHMFARTQPCKIFMKPEDVNFMFHEMVQRTEQLFFSPVEATDNRLLSLPSFLTALASIVKEMEQVGGAY